MAICVNQTVISLVLSSFAAVISFCFGLSHFTNPQLVMNMWGYNPWEQTHAVRFVTVQWMGVRVTINGFLKYEIPWERRVMLNFFLLNTYLKFGNDLWYFVWFSTGCFVILRYCILITTVFSHICCLLFCLCDNFYIHKFWSLAITLDGMISFHFGSFTCKIRRGYTSLSAFLCSSWENREIGFS